ncbi:hypothetical protein D6850_12285 [Roseovarius spongiae]|uniref:Uncharacterized protein n=1 Tax=Roseovarius spongiae TaxID=2320272 RepID=A0A3A8B8J7_9RHOB|nr:DUF6522 family protein [Roseovarius spongiae]RKF13958.1 hypothetical protein D6850_12285 [Roseovarius spongiae]
MSQIEIGPDRVQIDAEIVARALKLAPQELRERMREGAVTSRLERGEGEDEGRVRLTFFSATRRARITADASGAVLSCTGADVAQPSRSEHPAKAAPARGRPGAMRDVPPDDTFPASDPVARGPDAPE